MFFNFEKKNFRALLISYMTYNTSLYLNAQRMWARRHEEEIWLMISSLIWTWEPSMWPSVLCPTDRILLDNKNFDWFYDILVNFSYFHLKIVRCGAMNVANIMHQAIFRRTCLKCNPKANINSVSHWPGDDCILSYSQTEYWQTRLKNTKDAQSNASDTTASHSVFCYIQL